MCLYSRPNYAFYASGSHVSHLVQSCSLFCEVIIKKIILMESILNVPYWGSVVNVAFLEERVHNYPVYLGGFSESHEKRITCVRCCLHSSVQLLPGA